MLVNNKLTAELPISADIEQRDSLSPLLFNLIINKITQKVKNSGHEYKLSTGALKMVCYADDVVLLSENEDDLQRLPHFSSNHQAI